MGRQPDVRVSTKNRSPSSAIPSWFTATEMVASISPAGTVTSLEAPTKSTPSMAELWNVLYHTPTGTARWLRNRHLERRGLLFLPNLYGIPITKRMTPRNRGLVGTDVPWGHTKIAFDVFRKSSDRLGGEVGPRIAGRTRPFQHPATEVDMVEDPGSVHPETYNGGCLGPRKRHLTPHISRIRETKSRLLIKFSSTSRR